MISLSEEEIKLLLNWDDTFKATEVAMKSVSTGKATVSSRLFCQIFDTSKWMINMPGYLDDEKYGGWACKILSANPENGNRSNPVPVVNASVMLLDENTGAFKAVLGGIEITNWRTAAASAVATKYIHIPTGKPQKILSVFGCGDQGRAHAECFYQCFQFDEIRLWNRTIHKAKKLAKELNEKLNTTKFKVFGDIEECARGADVIVTTSSPGPDPLIKYEWLKQGIHINAVGVIGEVPTQERNFELDEETYKNANVYVDSWNGANTELKKLIEMGAKLKAEVGEIILGNKPLPDRNQLTVFQSLGSKTYWQLMSLEVNRNSEDVDHSLESNSHERRSINPTTAAFTKAVKAKPFKYGLFKGMAVEDCAMARMIYDLHIQKQNKT